MAQQNKDTNELIKVRRQKLADLQAAGKNPFEIMKYDVTHHSKEIKDNFEELEGKEVAVAAEYTILGKECENEKMYEAAIANYNKALELYPDAQEPSKRINLLTKRKQK